MKTQISRASDRPERRYSGVYQQQGRMITDADWNELVEILKRRLDDTLADVVGSGIPQGRPLRLAEAGGQPVIVPGEVYVDGLHGRVAGDAPVALTAQVDFPGARPIPAGTDAWVYADLWERSVDALEDGALRDPGLHGADTTTRSQTMVQVKWWPVGAEPADPCANPRIGDATVQVKLPDAGSAAVDEDGCVAVDGSSVRIGNYLFRVEVHEVEPLAEGAVKLTLKWSGENGAEQCAVAAEGGAAPDLANVPEEFLAGPWSWELCDDAGEKRLGVHPREARPAARPLLSRTPQQTDLDPTVRALRRWDGHARFTVSRQGVVTSAVDGQDHGQAFGAASGPGHAEATSRPGGRRGLRLTLAQLEFEMRLDGRSFLSGDHWLAVVRESAVDAARVTVLNDGATLGVRHHYLLLGEWRGGRLVPPQPGSAQARQRAFPPLSALQAGDVGYDPSATRERWLDIGEQGALAPRWLQRVGGAGSDAARAIGADGAGNVFVGGSFEGVPSAGPLAAAGVAASSTGVFVASFDADGQARWIQAFVAGPDSQAQAIAVDARGFVVLVGTFTDTIAFGAGAPTLAAQGGRDVFVARLRADGSCLWAKAFGATGADIAYAVALDRDGNPVVAGCFEGSIGFGGPVLQAAGHLDVFVAKLAASDGHPLWSRRLGATGYEVGHAIAAIGDDMVVSGFFQGTLDVGGGLPPLASHGKSDAFVLRLDPQGAARWATGFGGSASDYGRAVAVDGHGDVYVAGGFQGRLDFGDGLPSLVSAGGYDAFLAKLGGADGRRVWSQSLPAAAAQQAFALAVDSGDQVSLAGCFSGRLDFGGTALVAQDQDLFVATFGADGVRRHARQLGATGIDLARALVPLPGGGVALAGSTSSTLSIGELKVLAQGPRDAFVLALAPAGAAPVTVQQALDQLAGGLESSDIDHPLPDCGDPARRHFGDLLGAAAGWAGHQRIALDTLLDALLCRLDADTIPTLQGEGWTTLQETVAALWAQKVAKAGDRMSGALVVAGGGLAVGDLPAPGDGHLLVKGNCTVQGDLVVNGATTTISTANLVVEDNVVELNRYEGNAANTRDSGLAVYRGAELPARLQFVEGDKCWKVGIGDSLLPIATGVPQDVVTGVVTFNDLPTGVTMVSPAIDPGLGAGPLAVELGLEDWPAQTISQLGDEALRPVLAAARVDRAMGRFSVLARRTSGARATARLRWWARMPRLPEQAAGAPVAITVAVEPHSWSMQAGQTKTFSATVGGAEGAAIDWSASGGAISASGVYTPTAAGVWTVTARCQADPTKRDDATVTVTAVTVTVSPANPTIGLGQSQTFTATVSGTSNPAVTWSATGGTIDAAGRFTATMPGTFQVTATSQASTNSAGSTTVNVPHAQVVIGQARPKLAVGGSTTLTATVSGATDTRVTWWCTTAGLIDANSGVFTAPSSLTDPPMSYRVTAQSVQDPAATASVWVDVVDVSVRILPAGPVQVEVGDEVVFTAVVSGGVTNAVTWTVSANADREVDPADPLRVTVTVLAPAGGTRTLTARSSEPGNATARASLRVTPINNL